MDNNSSFFPSEDEINNIANYREGCKLIKTLGLKLECVDNLDDVKEVLTLKYHQKQELNDEIPKIGLYEEYPQLMNKLKVLLKKMENFKNSERFKKELGDIFKLKENKIKTIVKPLEEMIESQKFPILIAGEAKAGKSTFINLLINKDIMPTGLEVCNRIICEIQNSNDETVTFSGPDVESSTYGKDKLKEIKEIIKRNGEEGFILANFKYPVNFLENYTYLVDSPGIGDSIALENVTFEYLSKNSPALIFVLNSTNSYGLDTKAKELILKSKTVFCNTRNLLSNFKSTSGHMFQYEKAIFIFNHMDVIKDEISDESDLKIIKKIMVKEIKNLWHENTDEKTQIFFICAKKAYEWQKEGIVQDVVIDIRNCIRNLIVHIYERNLQYSIKELGLLCSKLEKKILAKLNTIVDYEYRRKTDCNNDKIICGILQNTLTEMEDRKNRIMLDLRPKLDIMADHLTNHLKSDDVEKRIIESYKSKIDPKLKDIQLLIIIFRKYFETQIFEEIRLWEKNNKQMENLYDFLNDSIERNLNEICSKINFSENLLNKENLLNSWNESCEKESSKSSEEFINILEKVFIFSTFTVLFPIVALAGILATPLIISHIVREKKFNEEQWKLYDKDKVVFLKNQSSQFHKGLSPIFTREYVFNNVEEKCKTLIDNFKTVIENNIKEREISINNIENEGRDFMDMLNSMRLLFNQMETFYSELEILKINCVSVIDSGLFVLPSVYGKVYENEKTRITEYLCTGQFSQVFRNENYKSEVFKAYSKEFNKQNARFQMQEIDLLRKHPSDFMVRCKSVMFLKKENKMIMVLESVDCNLYTYLRENQVLIPLRDELNVEILSQALYFLLDVFIQIGFALKYLFTYETRMVHPDLSLFSILVRKTSEISKIKILFCDACCNLSIKTLTKYSQSEFCDMGGFTKENISRFGLIFYQIVNFRKYHDIGQMTEDYVDTSNDLNSFDILPYLSQLFVIKLEEIEGIVPKEYVELIKKCVSQKPEDRPSITDILDDLENLKKITNKFISIKSQVEDC